VLAKATPLPPPLHALVILLLVVLVESGKSSGREAVGNNGEMPLLFTNAIGVGVADEVT